ncbi:deiodinase [Reticulomyxa filosa]|uniref:Deiodinase n=1 Tax=Reticulomyxa filosa TaxID=46433 RepID=X6NAA9_RETFI|nr:deiodinase [Reticulomyxa filosa]|eukprot:ETO22704.1 deiodinase [Reticulomyxa filosa]
MERECPETCEKITRDVLLQMLKRENELRLSKEALEEIEMESREYDGNDNENESNKNKKEHENEKVHIPMSIMKWQERVVREFGYESNDEVNYALQTLRSARRLYPNDMEIKDATYYLKYNRINRGTLGVGDEWKDVTLMTCNAQAKKLSDIIREQDSFNFVFVYILEAHASDEWPIRTKPNLCIKQHASLKDRCSLAIRLIDEFHFQIPVFVDTMDNCFQTTYAAWPLRAFLLHHSTIQFILQPKWPEEEKELEFIFSFFFGMLFLFILK